MHLFRNLMASEPNVRSLIGRVTVWPVFLDGSPDDRDDTALVRVGEQLAWYVQLYDNVGDWPQEMIAELDVTVRRHGRGGGTAVLVSDGGEFAMDGDRYPVEGGRVRGALYELGRDDLPSVRLAPVVGVARRIRIATRTRRGVELRDTEECRSAERTDWQRTISASLWTSNSSPRRDDHRVLGGRA